MSKPITEPGWYKLGANGLERVADLDDPPDETRDLVKAELDVVMTEDPLW